MGCGGRLRSGRCLTEQCRNWHENCLLIGLESVRMRSVALAGLLFACCWLALSAQQTQPIKLPVIDGRGYASATRHADSSEKPAKGTTETAVVEGQLMMATGLPISEYIAAEGKSLTTGPAESSPCSALDCLLKELLASYVSAEKVYWHLRLAPAGLGGASGLPERLARDMCSKTLETVSLIMQLKCFLGNRADRERAELMTVVAAKQSELHALKDQAKETAGS
jgi:hypothetical protein